MLYQLSHPTDRTNVALGKSGTVSHHLLSLFHKHHPMLEAQGERLAQMPRLPMAQKEKKGQGNVQ